jgi:hypothetical protein
MLAEFLFQFFVPWCLRGFQLYAQTQKDVGRMFLRRFGLSCLAIALPIAAHAQLLSHSLSAAPPSAVFVRPSSLTAPDTINVLAVMVQFQSDNDERTTGTGRFDTSVVSGTDLRIDAPPRNKEYFEDHLTFLANYYRKVSKGRVVIRPTMIPQVVTLPSVMGNFSPPKSGDNTNLALLVRDTWRAVDSARWVTNYSPYRCFIVFHAGVGRDIDLVSALGYDPTPLDLPSLYVDSTAMKKLLGINGVPVQGNTFSIKNTIIVPETETRTIAGAAGDVVLEYGINGLLCASFGNFLGLPDLFDTNTGRTAIGRFGLMDGQSIFSFNGAFPPEPSAWEKYWLGWVQPITVPAGTSTISLPAVALADTICKVPISNTEYYLIENRNRDPQRNGQTVSMRYRGNASTFTCRYDTTVFDAFDITALGGNVTDVEDFDWSLPGGLDKDGTFYDGGMLIWHIDESRIGTGQPPNSDATRRGVDLEEADGSQDLGQEYGFLSGASGSETGTALDFWYQGNGSPVNKNEFSDVTIPGTRSNDGAVSHVSFKSFSARGPRMTVSVSIGDQIQPLPGFPRTTQGKIQDLAVADVQSGGLKAIVALTTPEPRRVVQSTPVSTSPVAPRLYAWRASGGSLLPTGNPDGTIAVLPGGISPSPAGIALNDLNNDGTLDVVSVSTDSSLQISAYSLKDGNRDGYADSLFSVVTAGGPAGTKWGAAPVVSDSFIVARTWEGGKGGIVVLRKSGSLVGKKTVTAGTGQSVIGLAGLRAANSFAVSTSEGALNLLAVSPTNQIVSTRELAVGGRGSIATGSNGPSGSAGFIAQSTENGSVSSIDEQLVVAAGFPRSIGAGSPSTPALADIDGDGSRDVVAFTGNAIWVIGKGGAAVDHFPVTVASDGDSLQSNPIVADVNGDGHPDIIGVTLNGLVVAYDANGRMVSGFPLAASHGSNHIATVFVQGDSICLAVASLIDGTVYAWKTGKLTGTVTASAFPWPQPQHDAGNTSSDYAVLIGTSIANDFFPASRAYNWPNPVYSGVTYIRYYLREQATVKIAIYDVAGDKVTEFAGTGIAGVDNEVAWDVSGVQSGVYFAHIEATGNGNSGKTIVKIAVVK